MSRGEIAAALPGRRVDSTPDSLAKRGHLHTAGPRGATRYFEHKAYALAHAAACGSGPRLSNSKRARALRLREAAAPAAPAPSPPVSAPATQPTATASRLFRDLGPGQYVDAAPRTWVAAITRRA